MSGLLESSAKLDRLVSRYLPDVGQQLQALEMDWLCVTPEWFVHLFFDCVEDTAVVLHIWDLVLWVRIPPETRA